MSLVGTYDDDNIFAKIVRGEVPSIRVYEDDSVLAFMDVFPHSPGHTLVISKKARARNLLDMDVDDLGKLMPVVQNVAQAIDASLQPDGINIMQLNGAPAGQTVFHLHFHVIPRYENVTMLGHGQARMADMSELEALAAKIRAGLSGSK